MYSNFSKYGEALKELIQQVFVGGSVVMEPPETVFQYAIKQTKNDLKFPLISFYPDNTITLDTKNISMPSYKEGLKFQNPIITYNEDGSIKGTNDRLAKNVKFLYIIIGYQLDVWATTRLEAEQTMQELIFWLYENQQISTKLQDEELNFTFEIDNQIVDNSDLASYQSQGKLYRFTLNINLQGVLLRTRNFFTLLKPEIVVNKKD